MPKRAASTSPTTNSGNEIAISVSAPVVPSTTPPDRRPVSIPIVIASGTLKRITANASAREFSNRGPISVHTS